MGKPKHSDDTRGEQKGAQEHGEGQHGPKAYEARKREISDNDQQRGGRQGQSERAQHDPRADGSDADDHEAKIANPTGQRDGRHPLFENRLQHDEADPAADKNRLTIDVERHGHDRDEFQIPGGHAEHPAATYNHSTNVKSTGDAGGNRNDADRGDTGHS